jgi:hypothetical protein
MPVTDPEWQAALPCVVRTPVAPPPSAVHSSSPRRTGSDWGQQCTPNQPSTHGSPDIHLKLVRHASPPVAS